MTIVKLGMLGLALTSARAPGPESRPNVVLIIADDLAWDDTGAFGHPTIRTPNVDGLARGGMRFDRAFVTASSCSPSRSSLITGRYPHATGAEELHWPLPVGQLTFVERLKALGYYTAAAGKWHLGNPAKVKFDLVREGNPAAFQLGTGGDARSKMTAAARAPRRPAATSGSPCSATGPRTSRSSPGSPRSTRTASTRTRPSPTPTASRTSSSRRIYPTSPRSAKTWPPTMTRPPGSTITSARSWPSWTARGSPGRPWSCSSATTAGRSPGARRRSTTRGSRRR